MGVEMAFKAANIPMPKLAYFCQNGIPFGSGLGSSSAAIVSGLLAGLVLTGQKLKCHGAEELLQIAATVEGKHACTRARKPRPCALVFGLFCCFPRVFLSSLLPSPQPWPPPPPSSINICTHRHHVMRVGHNSLRVCRRHVVQHVCNFCRSHRQPGTVHLRWSADWCVRHGPKALGYARCARPQRTSVCDLHARHAHVYRVCSLDFAQDD